MTQAASVRQAKPDLRLLPISAITPKAFRAWDKRDACPTLPPFAASVDLLQLHVIEAEHVALDCLGIGTDDFDFQ